MLSLNFPVILGAALIPMVVGFLYYNPKTLEPVWMREAGLTREQLDGGNMGLIMGLSYLLSVLMCVILTTLVIHQFSVQGLFAMQPELNQEGTALNGYFLDFMSKYGNWHRTFGHGVVHGAMIAIGVVFPIIAIKSMFERKSWKYIFISAGYWLIVLCLVCGVLCQFT